ncbi:hypothetical protein RAH41_14030 [Gottfriedia acidiceleris]
MAKGLWDDKEKVVETTLGIYSHSNEEMHKNTADRFDEKFGLN